jgi:hypothetical protein
MGIPLLLLAGRGFLTLRWQWWLLILALAARVLASVFFPQEGLAVKTYRTQAQMENQQWKKTYQSLLHPTMSGLMRRPYSNLYDFPLEWLNHYNSLKPRRASNILVEVEGWARIPEDWSLAFLVTGQVEVALMVGGRPAPVADRAGQLGQTVVEYPPGPVQPITGYVRYQSIRQPDWAMKPVLVSPSGEVRGAFDRHALWLSRAGAAQSQGAVYTMVALAWLTDVALLVFLAAWLAWTARQLWRDGVLDAGIVVCACLGVAMPVVLRALGTDATHSFGRGMGLASAALLVWCGWQTARGQASYSHQLGLVVLAALGPGLFAHYVMDWWHLAPRFTLYGVGGDPLTYQRFARYIALRGDWLQFEQNPVFTYQPLYRYVVSILHLVFGQSSLAQRLMDVWSVVGAASLMAVLLRRWGLDLIWCVAAPGLYLWHLLNDRFLFLIGSGLQEYLAMLPMMLAAWAMGDRKGHSPAVWWAGVFGLTALWLRQDHVLGLAAIVLLAYPPIRGDWSEAWRGLVKTVVKNWRWMVAYFSFLLGGLLLVAFRNWLGGGEFVLTKSANLAYLRSGGWEETWQSVSLLLNANEKTVGLGGKLIWAGVVAGLAGLSLRFGPIKRYPLEISLLLLAIIAPYFYVKVIAYPPRFSVHLLPWATMSLILFAEALYKTLHHPKR